MYDDFISTAACTVLRRHISGKKQKCTGKADMLGMHGKIYGYIETHALPLYA